MSVATLPAVKRPRILRTARKTIKHVLPIAVAAFFLPKLVGVYLVCGLLDVFRNRGLNVRMLERYFAGNGWLTWFLSPFNLLMDLLTLPYRNKGVYRLCDLPDPYADEIQTLIDAAHRSRLVERLADRVAGQDRVMMFFKWYGKNRKTSLEVPEFHRRYKYIRTIGVSVFNQRQSTSNHFGPLRVTLRVLYNINPIDDENVYIQVGDRRHRWRDEQLFIFDDTMQHKSCNESTGVRYCLFVDILRPSLLPGVMSGILSTLRVLLTSVNFLFYQHWKFIK